MNNNMKYAAAAFLVVLSISGFLYFYYQLPFNYIFADLFIAAVIFSILAPALSFSSKYIPYDTEHSFRFILTHLVAAISISFLWSEVSHLVVTFFIKNNDYLVFYKHSLGVRYIGGLLLYSLIGTLSYLNVYYKRLNEKTKNEITLHSLITEAELKSLKYQINPHFIFNSLNSIVALTTIDPSAARVMAIKLSDFLRNTLSKNLQQMHSLREEILCISLYMDIEKIRFHDRINFIIEVNDTFNEVPIPNMILQPLVENAVKYGVYGTVDKVDIKVKSEREENYLKLSVTNTYDPSVQPSVIKGTGTGFENTRKRLALLYGTDNLFSAQNSDDSFIATVFIPI